MPANTYPRGLSDRKTTDCYELLHFSSIGRGTLDNLARIFAMTKPGWTHRSVLHYIEHLRTICIKNGIEVERIWETIDTAVIKSEKGQKVDFLIASGEDVPTNEYVTSFGDFHIVYKKKKSTFLQHRG